MQKAIKIFFNISYIVSLSAVVFLGGVINKISDKKGQNNKEGITVLGSNLSVNSAHADLPNSSSGDGSDNSTDCDGGGEGGSC